jgi:hypothetical protein
MTDVHPLPSFYHKVGARACLWGATEGRVKVQEGDHWMGAKVRQRLWQVWPLLPRQPGRLAT